MVLHLENKAIVMGEKGQYVIKRKLKTEKEAASYICQSTDGMNYRMTQYGSQCTMSGDERKIYLKFVESFKTIPLMDHGYIEQQEFDLFRDIGYSAQSRNVNLEELIRCVIPCLNENINDIHQTGLLIRTICTQNIFYDPQKHGCWIENYSWIVSNNDYKAHTYVNIDGIASYYYAPECKKRGWSFSSDYFSFGVAVLLILKGEKLLASMSSDEIEKQLLKGVLLGINRSTLSRTQYNMLSMEQKVMYLIAGLTLSDPEQRWGYSEVRCWCMGQKIPIQQTGGKRIRYQMCLPFDVEGQCCWDYWQLSSILSKGGIKAEQLLPDIAKHMSTQNQKIAQRLWSIVKNPQLSSQGKIFYTIYSLTPEIKEFWWNGKFFKTITEFSNTISKESGSLSLIGAVLRDQCISYWIRLRGCKTDAQSKSLSQQIIFEQWEKDKEGMGASRFMMWMTAQSNPFFEIDGQKIFSLLQLLTVYKDFGIKLQRNACHIIPNQQFQSWLWIKGISDFDTKRHYDQQEAFFALLTLCEKNGGENSKIESRKMYLKWGPYAEITWLKEHLDWYEKNSDLEAGVIQKIKSARWSENCPLAELRQNGANLLNDYRYFVNNTTTNPFNHMCGIPGEEEKIIRPVRSDGYFCLLWNGEKVSTDFMYWIGGTVSLNSLKQWCDDSSDHSLEWIKQEEKKLKAVSEGSVSTSDTSVALPILCMILWLCEIIFFFVISMESAYNLLLNSVFLIISAGCPLYEIVQYCNYYLRLRYRNAEISHLNDRLQELETAKDQLQRSKKQIYHANVNSKYIDIKKKMAIASFSTVEDNLSPVKIQVEMLDRVLMVVSNITLATMLGLDGTGWVEPVSLAVYSGIAAIALSQFKNCKQAFMISLGIQLVGLFLFAVFGKWMLAGLLVLVGLLGWTTKKF